MCIWRKCLFFCHWECIIIIIVIVVIIIIIIIIIIISEIKCCLSFYTLTVWMFSQLLRLEHENLHLSFLSAVICCLGYWNSFALPVSLPCFIVLHRTYLIWPSTYFTCTLDYIGPMMAGFLAIFHHCSIPSTVAMPGTCLSLTNICWINISITKQMAPPILLGRGKTPHPHCLEETWSGSILR